MTLPETLEGIKKVRALVVGDTCLRTSGTRNCSLLTAWTVIRFCLSAPTLSQLAAPRGRQRPCGI